MDPEKIAKLKISAPEQGVFTAKKRGKTWIIIGVAALALVAGLLHWRGSLSPAKKVTTTGASLVYPSQVLTEFNASGYIVAQRKAAVASKGTGRIVYLGVQEGTRVKEGDVIARLDSDDIKAEKAQAEAQLVVAKADLVRAETELITSDRNFRRYADLYGRKAVSQVDYENAEDRFLKAKAAVNSSKANIKALEASVNRSAVLIEYTIIRAPFEGVVLTKDADVGEVVAPFGSATNAKAAVVTMADLASLMAQVDVAEAFLGKVHDGQPCEIQLDAIPNTRFHGKVHMIVPTADRTRGTVMVKVSFDRLDPRVLPEMSTKVGFLSRNLTSEETQPFLAVHKDALTSREGRGIFRVSNGKAEWIPMSDPKFMGDYVLLGPPIQNGDRIALKPPKGLEQGDRVEIAE